MAGQLVPSQAWNCHLHCLDPEKFPYKPNRAYTPQPAKLESLLHACLTDNIMIVQATIEKGHQGLVNALERCQNQWPERTVRGTVLLDDSAPIPLHDLDDEAFAGLHSLGVRSVRIHGAFGTAGSDVDWVMDQFRRAAELPGIARHGWSISAQLPLQTWSSIAENLLADSRLSACTFVVDHNGSTKPEDVGGYDMAALLKLLESRRAYIKIGALHRRSPEDITRMEAVVRMVAERAPLSLVWGSDWPHCDSKATGPAPAPSLTGVDSHRELEILRKWLTDEQWTAMLVGNPERIFR